MVGECTRDTLYECFFQFGDRYFCAVGDLTTPNVLASLQYGIRAEIAS